MSDIEIFETVWTEDGSMYVMARVSKKDASHNKVPILTTDFGTITRSIYDLATGLLVTGMGSNPETLIIATVVLNTLSTGTFWTKDTIGFNFIDLVPATAFPSDDREFLYEAKFTTSGSVVSHLRIKGPAVGVQQS